MANKHMKRCLTLIIWEMQFKATMRYYITATKMDILKKKKVTSVGEDVGN